MKNINLKTPKLQAISKLIKGKIDMCESFIRQTTKEKCLNTYELSKKKVKKFKNDVCFIVEEDGLLKFKINAFGVVNHYNSIEMDNNIELDKVNLVKKMIREINSEYESFVNIPAPSRIINISLQKVLKNNLKTTGFIPNPLTGPFEIEQAIEAKGTTTIPDNFCKNYHSDKIIEELVEMLAKSDIRVKSSQLETLNYNEATNLFDIKIDGVTGVNKDGDIKWFLSTNEANMNGYLTEEK